MSGNGNCTNIPANADVAGIGIRLSIYITTIIIALVPNVEETGELRGALLTAAGLNGFALLITALIETANRSLTLYHAIIIIHMLSFLGIATNPVGAYRATPARLILYGLTTWMVFTLLFSWMLYVLVTAPTFGAPGACNGATIYVVMFVSVRATIGWLRWLFVAITAISLFVMICAPIIIFLGLWDLNRPNTDGEGRDVSASDNSAAIVRAGEENALELGVIPYHSGSGAELQRVRGSTSNGTTVHGITATLASPPPPQRAHKVLSALSKPVHLFPPTASKRGVLGRSIAAVYGVVMLELTIQRNEKNVSAGENQWAFGQIVAMLVTVGSLNEVFHFLLAEYDKWKKMQGRRRGN